MTMRCLCLFLSVVILQAAGKEVKAGFEFADFKSTKGLSLAIDTERVGQVLRLTPAQPNISGSAWYTKKQAVAGGFETTFQFRLTGQGGSGGGADGLAFVVQNDRKDAIAGRGASGGFGLGDGVGNPDAEGIPKAFAVFFDTYHNDGFGDPSDNFVAVYTNGKIGQMQWPPPRLGITPHLKVKMKDGEVHTARIVFQPPLLAVYLDDFSTPVLQTTADLAVAVDKNGSAYVGFTASTGSGFENHDVLAWSFSSGSGGSGMASISSTISFVTAACLADKNLCTPDRPVVEPKKAGAHRIVLPAHLEWGASIENPSGRPVEIREAKGTVCWDKTRLADGCSGPEGGAALGGQLATAPNVFLSPEQKAGALIQRTRNGKTEFSVNDLRGLFSDNEGFFEFEAVIR
jgi:hypothetical protein